MKTKMKQRPRHDAHGNPIQVGDTVRFLKAPDEVRTVADFDTLAFTGVRFEAGGWTHARNLEVVKEDA